MRMPVVAIAAVLAGAGTPAAGEEPPRPGLSLDVARHVDEVLRRNPDPALPRFEERVEVREDAQAALDARLRGLHLDCRPLGMPSAAEMREQGGAAVPPHADFVAVARVLWKGIQKLRGRKDRFFVYVVRRDGAARVLVREGEMSVVAQQNVPGTTWELVARLPDRDAAVGAARRLERGASAQAAPGERLPPWFTMNCALPEWK
jgi:hypothetical protein